jgi:hypothetical protein
MSEWTKEFIDHWKHEFRHGNEFDMDTCRDAIDEIERLQSELAAERESHRWIPVSERMPEGDCRVPVLFDVLGASLLGVAFYYAAFQHFKTIDTGEDFDVTHWQQLPSAPEVTE